MTRSWRPFDLMRPREIALAVACANRIMMEFLVKAGVNREELESAFRAKAGELIGRRYEDGFVTNWSASVELIRLS